MTDKQIRINGVDVAGCEYLGLYKECKLKCGSCCPVDCSDNPNCHYKLYKRKEQECEELKKQLQSDNCLTEIKNICENNDELQGDFNVVDCDKYKLGKHNLANKIIQKISEYEVGNERN